MMTQHLDGPPRETVPPDRVWAVLAGRGAGHLQRGGQLRGRGMEDPGGDAGEGWVRRNAHIVTIK